MLKLLLAAAVASGQAAAPNPERCITREEVGNVSLVGASVAVEVVRNACRTYLPATAFLATQAGADFAARLRVEGEHRLDSALDGVTRLSGDSANMPRTMMRAMVQGMMTQGAGADFARFTDASLCRDANEILEIASTLSPDQMARLVGDFASIADHVARMHPPHPTPAAPHAPPPGATPPALHPAPPETAPPAPHPAAFEVAPTHRPTHAPPPPPVVVVPTIREPGAHVPQPPIRPFLCQQAQ
jgi:hypothetical protein